MSIPKPPKEIFLLYQGGRCPEGEWLWCEDEDPNGEYRSGVDSIKYIRCDADEQVNNLANPQTTQQSETG